MEGAERGTQKQQLHKAVYLEQKTRSTLATELQISEKEVEDLASSLIEERLLKQVEDDPEPKYKYQGLVQDGLEKMRDTGLT